MSFPIVIILALAGAGAGDWECKTSDRGLWRCQSANLRPPSEINVEELAPAPVPRIIPTPVPEEKFEPVPAAIPRIIPTPVPEEKFEPVPIDAWVLQVGAFQSRTSARAEAGLIASEKLILVPIERDGKTWHLLLLGSFPTRQAAQSAGENYLLEHPLGSFWVRSAAGLREVLQPGSIAVPGLPADPPE